MKFRGVSEGICVMAWNAEVGGGGGQQLLKANVENSFRVAQTAWVNLSRSLDQGLLDAAFVNYILLLADHHGESLHKLLSFLSFMLYFESVWGK